MNRSFRAADSQMPQRQGRNLGTVTKEKEEELALFLEMRKREKERNNLLLQSSDDFESPLGSKPGSSPIFKIVSSAPSRKTGPDDFLNSDGDKNDYDWLLTPPGTPLFPSLEMESHGSTIGQIGTPKARPTSLKSRLANHQTETAPRGNFLSRQPISSSGPNSTAAVRRPLSSASTGSAAPRHPTPTGRPTLPAATKPATKPSRPSTPTSRATVPSSKPTISSARPSTPTARSSTPTSRPSVPASKSLSRSSTPTRRPSTPSAVSNTSIPPARSSSVTKSRSSIPARSNSPAVKPRPWKPSEMPGFSLDAPPNLRTTMPERPVSATRGRPGAPSAVRPGTGDGHSNGKPRRQSCSPTGLRGRSSSSSSCQNNGRLTSVGGRSHSNGNDSVSPVLIGSKMVDRVINMRRLAPPRQDDQRSTHNNLQGKSSSPDSGGFGRNLSKKSLDMALRHMDIRRSVPGGLRPLMTNIPASSMYSVRSGPPRSRTVSVSDSPLATSSNASSEQSVGNNILCLDGSEMEDDDFGSERGIRSSPAGQLTR